MPIRTAVLAHLLATAGLAATAHAQPRNGDLVPTRPAGTLYVNLQTGERALTRYDLNSKVALPVFDLDRTRATTSLFDYWLSLDPNPCWDNPAADGFAYILDQPSDVTPPPPMLPIAAFDFGDLPFDSRITGIILSTATFATEIQDANIDGIPDTGIDANAVFYDALSESNRTSIAPPTAAIRLELVPGITSPPGDPRDGIVEEFEIIVDFGDDWFELGDSDNADRGPLWLPGANPGQDITATSLIDPQAPNGLADFQYLQYYTKHDSFDRVTDVTTFMSLALPEGELAFEQFTTTLTPSNTSGCPSCTSSTVTLTLTYFIPDPLPQGQSANEGFGIARLGSNGNTANLDTTVGGCCFWFGGLDCAGFLDQLVQEPPFNESWYNFTPYAQNAIGLLSNTPPNDCATIDFNRDGILDNADIADFISAFNYPYDQINPNNVIAERPFQTADLNADGVIDNGDITEFVNRFLACTG